MRILIVTFRKGQSKSWFRAILSDLCQVCRIYGTYIIYITFVYLLLQYFLHFQSWRLQITSSYIITLNFQGTERTPNWTPSFGVAKHLAERRPRKVRQRLSSEHRLSGPDIHKTFFSGEKNPWHRCHCLFRRSESWWEFFFGSRDEDAWESDMNHILWILNNVPQERRCWIGRLENRGGCFLGVWPPNCGRHAVIFSGKRNEIASRGKASKSPSWGSDSDVHFSATSMDMLSVIVKHFLQNWQYTMLHYLTLPYITQHNITLHTLLPVHWVTLHYNALHYIIHWIALHYILHYITLHYITLHYITLHYITL